jgi:hypothetical protein
MSSKRRLRRRGCEGKHRHPTLEEAQAHIVSLARSYGARGLRPYRCKFCGAYHVGHAPHSLGPRDAKTL